MQFTLMPNGTRFIMLSPSDVVMFYESPFAAWAERASLEEDDVRASKTEPDQLMTLIRQKGRRHEQEVLKNLEKIHGKAFQVQPLNTPIKGLADWTAKFQMTCDAIKRGEPLIYQGVLYFEDKTSGITWCGQPDFLVRVKTPEGFSYMVVDAKFGSSAKPAHAMQLMSYVDLMAKSNLPVHDEAEVHRASGEPVKIKVSDHFHFYESVRDGFTEFLERYDADYTKMDPPLELNLNRKNYEWQDYVEALLRENHALQFVADIRTSQIKKLQSVGITNIKQLAATKKTSIKGITDKTFKKLRAQAKIQTESKSYEKPAYQFIEDILDLPPLDLGDIHYDMEGFPLFTDILQQLDGGLEYLFGVWADGKFTAYWADNRAEEKAAFFAFMKFLVNRFKQYPKAHIYHYAHYEVSALRRLAARYGAYQEEIETLVANGKFIDLYKIVRKSLLIGAESYGLKYIEALFTQSTRNILGTATAIDSIAAFGNYQELRESTDPNDKDILNLLAEKKKDLLFYNETDCKNLELLANWLRASDRYTPQEVDDFDLIEAVESMPGANNDDKNITAALQKITPDQLEALAATSVGKTVLALGSYHRREDAFRYAEYVRRMSASSDELFDDINCLAQGKKHDDGFIYFDASQPCKLKVRDNVVIRRDTSTVFKIDMIEINKSKIRVKLIEANNWNRYSKVPNTEEEEINLIPVAFIPKSNVKKAIWNYISQFDESRPPACAVDCLLRRIGPKDCDTNKNRLDVIAGMKREALAIQGPPGTGKTTDGAEIIYHLTKTKPGVSIAICAQSHAAIELLMDRVHSLASARDHLGKIQIIKLGEDRNNPKNQNVPPTAEKWETIRETYELDHEHGKSLVMGSTVYKLVQFDDMCDDDPIFDYLIIDEAGQFALADTVALWRVARNIVLLGDQQQLQQVTQALHPDNSGLSVLEYFLDGAAVVPSDKGHFLQKSYRLNPEISDFISKHRYDGKLTYDPRTKNHHLSFKAPNLGIKTHGIMVVELDHEDNDQGSPEEVAAIKDIVTTLLGQATWHGDGTPRKIEPTDIAVVTPYNLQVQALKNALPQGIAIGSVDKMQGQERPICILSMCSSDMENSARGLEFLYDPHRLNVAVTRAKGLAIIVCSKRLGWVRVDTLEKMRLVNFWLALRREV